MVDFPDLLHTSDRSCDFQHGGRTIPSEIQVNEGNISDEDDVLLDEILSGDVSGGRNRAVPTKPNTSSSYSTDHTQNTHSDSDEDNGNDCHVVYVHDLSSSSRRNTAEESSASSCTSSSLSKSQESSSGAKSHGTAALLERAHDRLAMQHLYEEIAGLQAALQHKNEEIETLAGQLRMAVSTKCDLVIAHTEMERYHENHMARKDKDVTQLKKWNTELLETKSQVERDLLSELVKLTDEVMEARKSHQQELDDWERLHRNEILEKDYQIAQLTEDIRSLVDDPSYIPPTLKKKNKKKGLKKLF